MNHIEEVKVGRDSGIGGANNTLVYFNNQKLDIPVLNLEA